MANTLTTAKTYYVRARHKATTGLLSDWGLPVKFTTAALTIDKPEFTIASRAVSVDNSYYTVALKPFVANGGQILLSVDWQVSTTGTFESILSEKLNDTVNVKQLPVSGLTASTIRYVRYRYRSSANIVSVWSDTFTINVDGYAVGPVSFVKTDQYAGTRQWSLTISGGDPNWGLSFAYTQWDFSDSPSFPASYRFISDAEGFTGTVTFKETNGSSSNQNYVRHLSTKTFAYEKTYYIRARKVYSSPIGEVAGPWANSSSVIRAPTSVTPVMHVPPSNGSTLLRFNGMYTFQLGVIYSNNEYPGVLNVVTSEWQILNAAGVMVYSGTTPGDVLNINGTVLVALANYRVRARYNAKTDPVPQYADGYPLTTAWSEYRTFMPITSL